jgi:transcriptional antiterminator NusG
MSENENSTQEVKKRWYVVQAATGAESYVKKAIEARIAQLGIEDSFEEILVPTEQVVSMQGGSKRNIERKFFPSYVLVKMAMTDETWHAIKGVPKVRGFIGGERPSPISEKEAQAILDQVKEGVDKPKPKVLFEVGEVVRVTEGPFADFNGAVEEVNYEKSRLRVAVMIFGRSTPVELEFGQVEKA